MTEEERTLQAVLKAQVEKSSFGTVAKEIGVSAASVWKYTEKDIPPQKWRVRQKYGLSVLIPTPPCKVCGAVHTKGHPKPRQPASKVRVSADVEPAQAAALDALAKAAGVSRAAYIRMRLFEE